MRLYPLKRYFRLKRILVFAVLFGLILIKIKTGKDPFWSWKETPEEPKVTIKRYEIYKYIEKNFTVGSFLKNLSPGNTTYCNFRLGDSESFNYTDEDVAYSPELGDKGPYRVLYGVVKGIQFNTSETNTVTYATHLTLKYLLHIVEIATRWGGPVSIACFLPGTDAILGLKVIEKLCFCVREMENVNIHFVYHKNHPPMQMSLKNYSVWLDLEESPESPWRLISSEIVDNSTFSLPLTTVSSNKTTTPKPQSCYVPNHVLENSYRRKLNLVYPINVARNVARYGSRSKYILVSDIELYPSDNLVPEFLKMIEKLKEKEKSMGDHYFTKKKHVFVLPVFEVDADQPDVPRTKSQLLDLYDKKKAVYFHSYICGHCQRFPGIQRWLELKVNPRSRPNIIQPLVVVKREFPYHRWEPIFIGTNDEPLYSELLTWEGQQDKMTQVWFFPVDLFNLLLFGWQMHEMCLLEYRFVILNGAFLVHTPGIKKRKVKWSNPIPKTGFLQAINNKNRNMTQDNIVQTTTSEPGSQWRDGHMRRNAYLYQIITKDVMGRYRYNKRCKIH